jgi:hypothetical protein
VSKSLWFIVPVHGRFSLTAICLRQLRRTCDALTSEGIEATAVVIACDENLGTARALGFGTIERDNRFLSRKFNDGIQLACDENHNPRPADYVVPCGSDDWVDYHLFLDLPEPDTMRGFQRMSFVREDGRELSTSNVTYKGGCGIRIYPREIVKLLAYRPADEDRPRGCDTSILMNLMHAHSAAYVAGSVSVPELGVEHADSDPLQIVDWKSPEEQLNGYQEVAKWRNRVSGDPFEMLADIFPAEALEEMAEHYSRMLVAA